MTNRREFIQHASSSMAALGAITVAPTVFPPQIDAAVRSEEWDLTWTSRLTGKHKAVFDCAEVESGFGVFRAATWRSQFMEVLKVASTDASLVIVLRAHALVLALQQPFWDKYDVGRIRAATHPVTRKETTKNPVLLGEPDGLPAPLASAALPNQLARGVIVLACNLALQTWIDAIKAKRNVTEEEARKEAVAALIPGVILQPSGVFAATFAQENGCVYLRAS